MRPFRIAAIITICTLGLSLVLKFGLDFRGTQERGRVILSVVEEQVARLAELPLPTESIRSRSVWPNGFPALQGWLVLNLVRKSNPEVVLGELDELMLGRKYSATMATALDRWRRALLRWSRSHSYLDPGSIGPDLMLQEARRRYYEAVGLQKIGREFDATVYYLWAYTLLKNFIASDPVHQKIPEAVYLLGDAQMRFQPALAGKIRSDRFLNLCAELYPSSIWALRARLLWNDELVKNLTISESGNET